MSLCLASPPVSTDCAALIVLLTVCLYHCRTTITGHELVLGILPCLNWLCCTNCSPHCMSVSLSDDHFWTLVLGILPCLNWLLCVPFLVLLFDCVSVSLSASTIIVLDICITVLSGHELVLGIYPVWADCAALIVLLTVCLYHCRTTISGHELVLHLTLFELTVLH